MYRSKPTGIYNEFDKYISGDTYRTVIGATISEVSNMVKGFWHDRMYKQAIVATLEFPLIVWSTSHIGYYFLEEIV